jgi:DNA-3-methyladenine glycosylase
MEQGTQIKLIDKKPLRGPSSSRSTHKGQKTGSSGSPELPPGALLPRSLFREPTERVAPRLLGKLLVHKTATGILAGRIVEVEAYLGPHKQPPDPAAHSYRGPTPRNTVIFRTSGHAYVYSIYGRYFCMNVTCEPEGQAGCILIRALEPTANLAHMALNRGLASGAAALQLTSGPSRLCQALGLTRQDHNGLDLLDPASPLQLRDDGFRVSEVLVSPRIGIKHAVDWPLRFTLPGHSCVSGPKSWPKIGLKRLSRRST